jgi:hypothetical protein
MPNSFLKILNSDPAGSVGTDLMGIGGVGSRWHLGFIKTVATVFSDLEVALDKAAAGLHPNVEQRNFVFAGHSLGGALAIIAGVLADSRFLLSNRTEIYTFEAPTVGNEAAQKGIEKLVKVYAFVDINDPIPHSTLVAEGGSAPVNALILGVAGPTYDTTMHSMVNYKGKLDVIDDATSLVPYLGQRLGPTAS